MSGPIVDAEAALARCVEAMRETLLSALGDALPQSTETPEATGLGEGLVDTVAQRLEWESDVEQQRIARLVDGLDQHFAALERSVLGLPDAQVEALDRDIAWLGAEASSLAQALVGVYDEAEALAARLEREVATQQVPFI
ncbi:hypothetical protein DQ04_00581120 [Trypanosoma grayi]|uniref:hypothetical protein n=1 Tax=Trypanosoma grayi TaxID=71804 RepID=UPI0004F3F120|nr:hypothetical protein DQ04_00581120 [Trypanosoma grayi]KEG14194.1 hypothetical protein DQ04_00581120 [Trypanosoma grayi]